MRTGRPSKYTNELAANICADIACSTDGLKTICDRYKIHPSTVFDWLADEGKKDFADMYARAKAEQAHFIVDEMVRIANDGSKDATPFVGGNFVQRDKLRVDTLKWVATKLLPDKYGDRVKVDGNINLTQITGMEIK